MLAGPMPAHRHLDDLEAQAEPAPREPEPAPEAPPQQRAGLHPAAILALQRTAGNTAVRAMLAREDDEETAGTAVADPKPEAASADATKEEPKASPETTKAEPEHPAPPKLEMDLASGEKVLTNAFGTVKKIVPGKIEIHPLAGFKAAYDKIYGKTPYAWDTYVVPKFGGLNGFAYNGVNYINSDSAGLHTVVHEMLHNNTAPDWRAAVGDDVNEGATEILTQVACKKLNVEAPTCYPGESPVVQAMLDAGLPLSDLEAAYLVGGAPTKVVGWVDANCKESYAAIKGYMAAKNWAAAKAGLAKKTA
jgi:hypothetical protein